jgi:hypothetical protein
MKRFLVLSLTFISSLCLAMSASAHPRREGPPPPPPPHHGGYHSSDRTTAWRVLEVTRDVIFRAQRVAHGYQQAKLDKAFYLQKQARSYYSRRHYQTTINYSIRARGIAENIIAEARRPGPPRREAPPRTHHDTGSSINVRINL